MLKSIIFFVIAAIFFNKINNSKALREVQSEQDVFKQVEIAGDKLVIVGIFSKECKSCVNIASQLEKLEAKYAAKIVMLKVDADKNDYLANSNRYKSMPSFVFVRNGEGIEELNSDDPEKLEKTIVELTS